MRVKYKIGRADLRNIDTFKKASKTKEDCKLAKETMKAVVKILCKTE